MPSGLASIVLNHVRIITRSKTPRVLPGHESDPSVMENIFVYSGKAGSQDSTTHVSVFMSEEDYNLRGKPNEISYNIQGMCIN